jgi:predicted transcriptional regulator
MNLRHIAEELGLELLNPGVDIEKDVQTGYVGDMLSDVMGRAPEGSLWITIQIHKNVIGVAAVKDLAGIILAGARKPQQDVVDAADEQGVPLFLGTGSAFDLAGRLYALGIRGRR